MKKPLRLPGAPTLWRLGDGPAPTGPHAVLLPGEQVPLLPVDLPEKLGGAARERVAERQLIEQLSLPKDAFELYPYAPKGVKSWTRTAVVDSELANAWRKSFGRGAVVAVPDFMALPAATGLWAVEIKDEMMRVRLGPLDGFAAEIDVALAQLADLPVPKAVLRMGDSNTHVDAFLAGLDTKILENPKGLSKAGFKILRWSDAIGALNLKDPPSAAVDRLQNGIRRWRLAVIAAVLGTVAWMGTVFFETQRSNDLAQQNRGRVQTLVREHFIPSGPILDVRAQVGAVVKDALQPDVVEINSLPALTQFQIAAALLNRDGTRLLSAAYRPETGLEAEIEAVDFNTLDTVVVTLQDAAFLVEQLESRAQQSGGVVARLRLELLE